MTTPDPCCCTGVTSCCTGGVQQTDSTITWKDRTDHLLARWGVNRMGHRVKPGLYRLGTPTENSPVFASANYTLSFDALRSSLKGIDAYILVLDTRGINVWCAAGKGTFGTDELVRLIKTTDLGSYVSHRNIIVPQLGAPGIAAHEVQKRTGFRVQYGPVRAEDLSEFLKTGEASSEMRRVRFTLYDRIVLAPVELVHIIVPTIILTIALWFIGGIIGSLAVVITAFVGTVIFPMLLPYLPTRDLSTKGFILGFLVAIPFSIHVASFQNLSGWSLVLGIAVPLLTIPAVISYMALNFTGSTTYTSRTGVKMEIFRYVPIMAGMAGLGILSCLLLIGSHLMGVI